MFPPELPVMRCSTVMPRGCASGCHAERQVHAVCAQVMEEIGLSAITHLTVVPVVSEWVSNAGKAGCYAGSVWHTWTLLVLSHGGKEGFRHGKASRHSLQTHRVWQRVCNSSG